MTKLPFNVRFEAAARFFASKLPLTREQFDRLADWAKVRAFTVATVTKAQVLTDVQDAIEKAIDDGLTFDDFSELLGDVMEARGWQGIKPWHAETVFRTNIQTGYGAGRLAQQREQRDDFPYLRLHEIDDDRTRPAHRAANGTVKPIGDPWWKTHYPPWGYNCRGYAESLTDEEARAIGISPTNVFEPSENEDGFASPGASDEFRPDLSSLDPALASSVRRALDGFAPDGVED